MPTPIRSPSDLDRKVRWLETQVRPVVREVRKHYSHRALDRILGNVGEAAHVDPAPPDDSWVQPELEL